MPGDLLWTLAVWTGAALLSGAYLRGAHTLRRRGVGWVTAGRALLFVAAMFLLAATFSWPLLALSQSYLLARMAQKVAICLVAAPLLWLSLPLHVLPAAAPASLRRRFTRVLVRHTAWTPTLRMLTSPVVAWLVYLGAFLMWHDPGFVAWEMGTQVRQRVALALLLGASLLFWQQVTLGGTRRYATASFGARIAMLVGAEIPNVVAGITIAFGTASLYSFYDAPVSTVAPVLTQQSMAGALTWVFGSIVYISAIVAVVNQAFQSEGSDAPQPPHNWDATEKWIAPGLEARVRETDYRPHDWREH